MAGEPRRTRDYTPPEQRSDNAARVMTDIAASLGNTGRSQNDSAANASSSDAANAAENRGSNSNDRR
jgi:hypothetical protein